MAYYKVCPLCGAHLDPGEACDCVPVYTGYPGDTHISMNMETGKIGRCSIYIGKDEPNPGAAYQRALAALEERMKEAPRLVLEHQSGGGAEVLDGPSAPLF